MMVPQPMMMPQFQQMECQPMCPPCQPVEICPPICVQPGDESRMGLRTMDPSEMPQASARPGAAKGR
jgi:hypothetical protein